MTIEEKMELFHILHLVFGVLVIVFLVLSIFLFFKLRIWETLLDRTGIARKKSISQMHQLNAVTGRLTKTSAERLAEQEFGGQVMQEHTKGHRGRRSSGLKPAPSPEELLTEQLQQESEQMLQEVKVTGQTAGRQAAPPFDRKFILTEDQRIIHTTEQILEVEL